MGTVVEKFQYIEGTKQAIKKAIKNKGVEVLDTDTFRSYAERIESIGGGGGSSVAEYKFTNNLGQKTYPAQPYSEDNNFIYASFNDYINSDKEFCCTSNIYDGYSGDVYKLFDGDDTTYSGPSFFFRFNEKKKIKKLHIVITSAEYWGGTPIIYGTNYSDHMTSQDTSYWTELYNFNGVVGEHIIDLSDANYQYFWFSDDRINVSKFEVIAETGVIAMSLSSANMTPSFKCYFDNYMQVITQDWHNGSEIIPSQTLTFKPYEDGGCLVNYTDDGKAVNLKLLYLKSNGELVGNIYDNYIIVGGLTTDKETGIVSGFSDSNKIMIPQTVNTDNWQFSIKANYKNTSRHQGIIYDNTRFRGLGEIHDSTQTMSSYITGSWTDGVVPLENGADYWFLFVVADNTLTSYVKKDNGYKSCPSKEEMEVNFTISDFTSQYGSFIGNQFGIGFADSNEHWESYIDISTASLVDDGVEVWNAATKVALKDTFVLAPDDDFTLEGYSEKTQVADLNIPSRFYFNGLEWILGVEDGIGLPE